MGWLSDIDWDDVLAYNTLKTVRIRHKYLGGFYYLAMFAILVFIVGYNVIALKGYNANTIPVGVVQAIVSEPATFTSLAELGYCQDTNMGDSVVGDDATADGLMMTMIRGTRRGIHSMVTEDTNELPCVRWDTSLISIIRSSSVLLGTHIHESLYELDTASCGGQAEFCNPSLWHEVNGSNADLYVGDVENYAFRVEHALVSTTDQVYNEPPLNALVEMSMTEANTVSTSEGVVVEIPREKGGEVILLKDILQATGINLDGAIAGDDNAGGAQGTPRQRQFQTYRETGMTIISTIKYINDGDDLQHSYDLQYAPMSAAFTKEVLLNNTHKKVIKVNGVRLSFQIGGNLHEFSFATLLITLVSGLALTASATTFTDGMVCYVLKHKDDYKLFKYETTPDFDPDDPLEKEVLAKVLLAKRKEQKMLYADESNEEGGPNDANTAASLFLTNLH